MKGIICIVFVTLISVSYGTFCEKNQKLNDPCGNKGKCATPICGQPSTTTPATTTTAAGPTAPGAKSTVAPGAKSTVAPGAKSTVAPAAATSAVAPTATSSAAPGVGRKRRAAGNNATCTATCKAPEVCLYQCTGESGSIKHGLSPLVLIIGVLTKLCIS